MASACPCACVPSARPVRSTLQHAVVVSVCTRVARVVHRIQSYLSRQEGKRSVRCCVFEPLRHRGVAVDILDLCIAITRDDHAVCAGWVLHLCCLVLDVLHRCVAAMGIRDLCIMISRADRAIRAGWVMQRTRRCHD